MQGTVVFEKNWNAIHELKEDGTRKYRYIVNTGSSRSSKTHSLLQSHYLKALSTPNTRISIWRDTKKDTKDTVLADFKKMFSLLPNSDSVRFNKTESIYYFPNGSTIEICGTDDDVKVHGFQGDVLHFNEPYKISKDTFDQLDMRNSGYVVIDWNPKKDHWIDVLSKQDNAIVIHSTFLDNPFCPPQQRKKILSYKPIKASNVVLDGVLKENDARVYDLENNPLELSKKQLRDLTLCIGNEAKLTANMYKWQVYGLGKKGERPNRIFHFEEIPYHEYLAIDSTTLYGIDWGVVDPMGIIEAKYYDGALYLHELSYKSENNLKAELTSTQKAQIEQHTEEGFLMWYIRSLGIPKDKFIICDNNRPLKIATLREIGYMAGATKKWKGSIIDGIDLLNNLKVYYTHTSINLKNEQENYSRSVDRRTGEVLEEPEDNNNHLLDPARYVAQFLLENDIISIV